MNICFLTEGGVKIGLGHISRCQSLADAFKEKKHQCKFIINANKSLNKNLRYETEFYNWIDYKAKLYKSLTNIDIIIIDSYNAQIEIYNEINKIAKVSIFFDDTNRIEYPSGFIINPAIYTDVLDYKENKNITHLFGPQYQPFQKPFWDIEPKLKNNQLKNILITFGGDDIRDLTPKVLGKLNHDFSSCYNTIVVGENFSNTKKIESLQSKNSEIVYKPNTNKICDLMSNTDLAICGGGQTLYELARLKTPALILGIAKNQENNINNWQDSPYYRFAGWWNDNDIIGRLQKELKYFINKFDSISKNIYYDKPIVDGQGSRRIVKEIITYVGKK